MKISTLGFPLLSLRCSTLKMNAKPLPEALENVFPEVQGKSFFFIVTLRFSSAYCLIQVQDFMPLKNAAACINMFPFISIPLFVNRDPVPGRESFSWN